MHKKHAYAIEVAVTNERISDFALGITKSAVSQLAQTLRLFPEIDHQTVEKLCGVFEKNYALNRDLHALVNQQLTTVCEQMEKIHLEQQRSNHLGRFMMFPLEQYFVDEPTHGKIPRFWVGEYISIIKSVLGTEMVAALQTRIKLLIKRYEIGDYIDWHRVFLCTDAKRILQDIREELRTKFTAPNAMSFFIKRMNGSDDVKRLGVTYTEEDFSLLLRLLFRTNGMSRGEGVSYAG